MYWNRRNIRFVSCLVTFLTDFFDTGFCFSCFHIYLIGILYNLCFGLSIPFLHFFENVYFYIIKGRSEIFLFSVRFRDLRYSKNIFNQLTLYEVFKVHTLLTEVYQSLENSEF